jgi:hypothetical protein
MRDRLVLLACAAAIISSFVIAGEELSPRFEIVVGGQCLISDEDIAAFEWESQTIYLTAAAQERIAALPYEWVPVKHSEFVVLVDGETAYSGHLCNVLSSLSAPAGPTISWPIGRLRDYFTIYPDRSADDLDIRFDESIRIALIERGKIAE